MSAPDGRGSGGARAITVMMGGASDEATAHDAPADAREFARAAELAADPAQRALLEQQCAAKVAKSPERR